LVVLSCFSLASSQYSVSDWTLPGFAQWQTDLRNHARNEGRPHELRNYAGDDGTSQGLSNHIRNEGRPHELKNYVLDESRKSNLKNQAQLVLESRLMNNYPMPKKTAYDLKKPTYQKESVIQRHGKGKLKIIEERGNKWEKMIENLVKISNHKKREIIHQKPEQSNLSKNLRSKTGLYTIIKQIIRNKLKKLQEEAEVEKSPVQLLLEESSKEVNFLDNTVGRSGSFLDRLIETMKNENVGKTTEDIEEFRKPKGLTTFDNTNEEDNEILTGMQFFANAGLLRKDQDTEIEQNDFLIEVSDFSTAEDDEPESFLEEELSAAQFETEELVDEIAELLVQLEGEQGAEDTMMARSHNIIKSKLGRFPKQMLLKDRDFIDSVFFRFAMMKMPLRTEDIGVAESFQIHKVLHSNIAKASDQTRSLLSELRKDTFDEEEDADRAKAIDKSRRELQKLLKIIQ